MDIKTLIRYHNDALEQRAAEDGYLGQRLKARLRETSTAGSTLIPRFVRTILLYGFLFLILTLVNIVVLDLVKKKQPESPREIVVKMEAFQPDYPGSFSRAYAEVINWEKKQK
jgi:hypothetical protein